MAVGGIIIGNILFINSIKMDAVRRGKHQIQSECDVLWRKSGLTRDGTAEPVSRDQIILRRERGQGNIHVQLSCCSADHDDDEQDCARHYYPVDQ